MNIFRGHSTILLALTLIAAIAGQHVAAAPPAAMIREPIDESQRIELKGHIHPALRASVDLGAADPRRRADRIIMVLHGSAAQDADLERFLKDVQTPGHHDYHRWMTPDSFAKRFGAAAGDRSIIRTWLETKGFRIDEEPAGGRAMIFSGAIGQVDDVFATRIHEYRWHGEHHVANAANPRIPRALAAAIAGFASLSDFRRQPQWVRSEVKPQYTSGSGAHALAPGDFATIYDLTAPYAQAINGSGRSIAVIGRSDVLSTDLAYFRSAFGLAASLPQVIVNGPDPGLVPGDELESDLDLEWAAAVAPSAAVVFVTTQSTSMTDGIDLSSQYAVSNNVADVISVSYGACESASDVTGGTTLYNQLWQQAAAQGTSVFVSSGDSGAAGCDPPSATTATQGLGVNLLCSSPFSTCVGGTEFVADDAAPGTYWRSTNAAGSEATALSYIGEAVWNQSGGSLYASGGGASLYYAKPVWQLTTGVPSDGRRDIPDIALAAASNHDPFLIYTSDGYSVSTLLGIGGTSASAPSMAGIAALIAQQQRGRVGNFNPVLYSLSALQVVGGSIFHQITSGNNSVPGQTGFSASTSDPLYNQATGLASVDAAQLLAHWAEFVRSAAGFSPTAAVIAATAVVGSATLTLPSTTPWSAVVAGTGTGWLSVTPASGKGTTPLTFAATANPSPSARTATITADGQVLTVTQAAATATNGNAAHLSLSSSNVGFGTDPLGNSTSSQPLLVSNTGNANLTLASLTLTGGAAGDYSYFGTCVAGLVLNPGASCYLTMAFDPMATGSRAATLQIGLSSGSSMDVNLSGNGVPVDVGSDGPMPTWAYSLLTALLLATAVRFRGWCV